MDARADTDAMTGPIVGSARIEITGDLSQFTRSADHEIRAAMGNAQHAVTDGGRDLERAAGQVGDDAGRSVGQHMTQATDAKITAGMKGLKSRLHEQFGDLAKVAAGAFAADKVVDFFKGSFDEATEAQKVGAQTAATLKATGEQAGITSDGIGNLAGQISNYAGIDDEAIQSGENLLLNFKNVHDQAGKGNDIFSQATKIATDYSVATGTSLTGAIKKFGAALDNPLKGMTALTKAGVNFTDGQKHQIKAMLANGDTMGAQKMILAQLQQRYAGSAAAQATEGEKASVAFGNLKEQVGTALLPVMSGFSKFLSGTVVPILSSVTTWVTSNIGAIKGVAVALVPLLGAWATYNAYTKVAGVVTKAVSVAQGIAAAITGTQTAATVEATVAQEGLNTTMAMNPIGLVVAAVAALVAGFVIAWKKSETFRNIVKGAFHGVKVAFEAVGHAFAVVGHAIGQVFKWVGDHWDIVFAVLTGGFSLIISHWHDIWDGMKAAWDWAVNNIFDPIGHAFDVVVGWITSAKDTVTSVFSTFFDGLYNAGAFIFNKVAWLWNHTLGELNFTIPDWVPVIGGDSFGFPTIQEISYRAKGGSLGDGLTVVGEGGPELLLNGQTVVSNPRTPGGNFSDFAGALGGQRLHPDDLDALARILMARPTVLHVDSVEIARATNNGNLRLARR